MRDMLLKWMPLFDLSLSLQCSSENFTTIRQICILYKLAQSGFIPLKIKCEILASKGS